MEMTYTYSSIKEIFKLFNIRTERYENKIIAWGDEEDMMVLFNHPHLKSNIVKWTFVKKYYRSVKIILTKPNLITRIKYRIQL